MKRKRFCAALVSAFLMVSTSAFAEEVIDYMLLPANIKKAEIAPTALYMLDVDDPTLYDWSSSNQSVLQVDNETGVFAMATLSGKATLTGTPKTAKVKRSK